MRENEETVGQENEKLKISLQEATFDIELLKKKLQNEKNEFEESQKDNLLKIRWVLFLITII